MPDKEKQWALERFLGGIDELKTVLGREVAPSLDRVKKDLIAAMAARDRGNRKAAMDHVAAAMTVLAGLGDRLGQPEGSVMRAITAEFLRGLSTAEHDQVERNLDRIQARAGSPKRGSGG